jgi:hypothetical protein
MGNPFFLLFCGTKIEQSKMDQNVLFIFMASILITLRTNFVDFMAADGDE